MKYWCPECKSELITNEPISKKCRFCKGSWIKLPDFETPSQYEKRTGRKLSDGNGDNFAVWYRYKDEKRKENPVWTIARLRIVEVMNGGNDILYFVVSNSPEPPPDDYVPEERDYE